MSLKDWATDVWLLEYEKFFEPCMYESVEYVTKVLTLRHWVFSLSSENRILLKGPSSPLNSLFDIENVDLKYYKFSALPTLVIMLESRKSEQLCIFVW